MLITKFVTIKDLRVNPALGKPILLVSIEDAIETVSGVFLGQFAAIGAFGDAAARIFEQLEESKSGVISEALELFDTEWANLDEALGDDVLPAKLARATNSAHVEEAI